ncbi:hypothetical protein C4577_06790 [Candidatus Parcubacteria bacterium]|nr:MAG: hypothetical protein C4577_06790 [Candidatus Parcubacteria bacterium]
MKEERNETFYPDGIILSSEQRSNTPPPNGKEKLHTVLPIEGGLRLTRNRLRESNVPLPLIRLVIASFEYQHLVESQIGEENHHKNRYYKEILEVSAEYPLRGEDIVQAEILASRLYTEYKRCIETGKSYLPRRKKRENGKGKEPEKEFIEITIPPTVQDIEQLIAYARKHLSHSIRHNSEEAQERLQLILTYVETLYRNRALKKEEIKGINPDLIKKEATRVLKSFCVQNCG